MNRSYGRRSFLCTPALSSERFGASRTAGADVGLVDLEDSVPDERKDEGRIRAEAYFARQSGQSPLLAVRMNATTTIHGLRDLVALKQFEAKPDIVIIPKVESPRDLEVVAAALDVPSWRPELLAVIETPQGIDSLDEIGTAERLGGFIFGSADYSAATGASRTWNSLLFARSAIANAAARRGLPAIDSPCFALTDEAVVASESCDARALGFVGKIAVHPAQVGAINKAFSPSASQVREARAILAASNEAANAATSHKGAMLGKPIFDAARAIVAAASNGNEERA